MSGSPSCMHNGLNGEEEEEDDGDLDDEADASQLRFMRDRRRAKSLPALLDADTGRKRVKFADSMGLTLTRVKHFSSQEEPRIPNKVLSRHRSFPPQHAVTQETERMVLCFPEPRDSDQRVLDLQVCLEKISITQFDVRGQIRVLESASVTEVGVRYTFNDWRSHVDAQALQVDADRFLFTLYTPPVPDPGSAVHFAVYMKSTRGEFWDNNQGKNYTLRFHTAGFYAT